MQKIYSGPQEIIVGERKSGKSTELIKISAERQIPIIVQSQKQVDFIMDMAKRMNFKIPKPLSARQWLNQKDSSLMRRGALVDEVQAVIETLLGSNVVAMTISSYGEDHFGPT